MRTFALIAFILITAHVNGQIMINEVCPSNADINHDSDFFDFSGWIELYNNGTGAVNVGNYYLTDDAAVKNKWSIPPGTSIPAKGFLLIWCDDRNTKLHTNFNLDSDGEEILLFNSSQVLQDKLTFPKQYSNISYGRTSDGADVIGYLTDPTPGEKNKSFTGALRLENPELSLKSGRYAATQTLTMQSSQDGSIYYTTDGSEPNTTSLKYVNPITVSKTTTVKAKAYKEGFLPSKTEVKTFFINEHAFTLPVVSLSTRPSFLFDTKIGIYVEGTNGVAGNCRSEALNWNQNWDRHAVFEYFDKSGSKLFDQNVDMRIGGACSRNNPQKSLAIKARDKYGSKIIEQKFFPTKDISEFGSLMLRNSGNDFYYTMFRDAIMQTLPLGKFDIDYMGYQPAIVYLNGNYWGIQNIREKIDGDYIEANFGVAKNDVDLIETYSNAVEGSASYYNMYLDSLQKIDLSDEDGFAFINRYIDVQEFINYLTAEIYYCNTDWPGNNVKFWRQRSTNGKFRWILWDLDFGFGLYQDWSYATHPTLDFATDPDNTDWPNPAWSTLHIRFLLQNPQFRQKFIQTFTTSLSTAFQPQRVIGVINDFENNIKGEMPFHTERWQLSMSNWNNEVERLRAFAVQRNAFMKNHIASFFGLSDQVRLSVNTSPIGSGEVELNGILTSKLEEGFYYRDLPLAARPIPAPGYKFSHYTIKKTEATTISLVDNGSMWKYYDQGSLPSIDWMSSTYTDNAWAEGAGELGYGDGDEKTIVGSGPGPDKAITTYFRKTFTVSDTVGLSGLSGNVLFDDGVVIFLNGEEVYRGNMPAGLIDNNTLSSGNQSSETTYFSFTIPKGKIKPGNNLLAVEVHQNSNLSSDISFDLNLRTIRNGAEVEYTSTQPAINDVANSDVIIEAFFTPVTPSSGLVINEVSAQNSEHVDNYSEKDDWIEIYNKGTMPIDVANYFITDDLSNKTKHRISSSKNAQTVVGPGEYKLLWADGDVNQGPLHLNFKLSAEGEEVGLYQMAGATVETIDEVSFAPQFYNTSFSRIPNITGEFVNTGKPTPMAANVFEVPTSVEEQLDATVSIYPNPTSSSFVLRSNEPDFGCKLINTAGKVIHSYDRFRSGEIISLDKHPSGVYLVLVTLKRKQVVKRVVKI